MELDIKDKVAVITGAGHGIGKAVALALAAEGARIAAIDREEGGLDALAAQAAARGLSIDVRCCDLSQADERNRG